ncbi:MAG: L-serine ammonia-lyase, iron-sulfur-dependent, subunit beta [Clostridiales bacterium]|uniref:L-serine ammonia-lyase, iron-sulfur-dependent subunit beta n=1 Tax=Oscillospiraceae TaxID=216572 RepID=UPI0009A7AFE5|nr:MULTISPECIES: L-serine ammonia-lyase, iron-sulfur-dependent subunit beta [Oscillospiraceae]PWM39731.1 MAG: L-serine ammonia-lyase, iron-sulfur-dependent, subunit beta [Clostridiales bacterium]RGB65576.1 L-serine ammonia-lyase, iron-sulfur-dependent, subunit beta [Harryflintia acetispora]
MGDYGVFDIIGPVMVGPSSSHTAGAARLGEMARSLCGGKISEVTFELHGSFAQTYQGHGTDKALLAGIIGLRPADERLPRSFELADQLGLRYRFVPTDLGSVHPNTVRFLIVTEAGEHYSITGSSVGGGNVVITDINGIPVSFTGESPIIVTRHKDTPGVISNITALLYNERVNIGNMRVNRHKTSGTADMYLELDKEIDPSVLEKIRALPDMENVLELRCQPDEF